MKQTKQKETPPKVCSDCIHEYACQAWNVGSIHNMNANHCFNYETLKLSMVYNIGKLDGIREATKGGDTK